MKTIAFVRATTIYDDSRATKEISALAEAGYRVEVLAWDRTGTAHEKCRKVFAPLGERVSLHFFSRRVDGNIGMKNLPKLLGWIRWTYRTLSRMDKPDAVHICNLDSALGAVRFCKKTKVPFVYDIYDYYIDSHGIPGPLVSAVEGMEISTINQAQATILCTEERREQISGANPREVVVIHNSPDVPVVPERPCQYDYVYCGALGERRLLGEILRDYPCHCELVFSFAGYGEYTAQARALSESYDCFHFQNSIAYEQVLEMEAGARAIAAIYEPTIRNHRLCAPNKFYEALALAKPVIVCQGTGIDRIVREHEIGIVISYSSEEFYQALNTLKANPKLCEDMGKRARAVYERFYRWSDMKRRLLQMYQMLI